MSIRWSERPSSPPLTAATRSKTTPSTGAGLDVVIDGAVLAARWEWAGDGEITVTVSGLAPALGTGVELRWQSLRGTSTARGTVLGVEPAEARGACRLRLQVPGPVEVVQRRAAVRAVGAGPVALTPLDRRLAPVHTGSLLDISEEGLRARFAGAPLAVGRPVGVHVRLGDDILELQGTVLRCLSAKEGYVDVIVSFAADEAEAAHIRRFVYLQQVRLRRAGLV